MSHRRTVPAPTTAGHASGGSSATRTRLARIVVVASVNKAGWRAVGTDDAYRYAATTLSVYWPEAEHRRLIERWPHLACEVGATWDEHRHQIERHCALVERDTRSTKPPAASVVSRRSSRNGRSPHRPDRIYRLIRTWGPNRPCSAGHRRVPVHAGAARAASTSGAAARTAWAAWTDAGEAARGDGGPPRKKDHCSLRPSVSGEGEPVARQNLLPRRHGPGASWQAGPSAGYPDSNIGSASGS